MIDKTNVTLAQTISMCLSVLPPIRKWRVFYNTMNNRKQLLFPNLAGPWLRKTGFIN
jgi:hypothetical protein